MSGIAGIINLDGSPVDRELLCRMTQYMTPRGPDAQQVWIDNNAGFGHTLLRTTFEAETEVQPLSLDGNIWLTADARIDGREELLASLEAKLSTKIEIPAKAGFRKPNDAELILYAYRAWEEDCVKKLFGDFSFAIWDRRKQRLFCARDQIGIRQFFYFKSNRILVFSNTLNCLRLHPLVSDNLNELAVADFLLFGLNQDPESTIFAGIDRLPKAHCLVATRENTLTRQYWTLRPDSCRKNRVDCDYIEEFKQLFEAAVNDRLRADRASVSMSGGMDSTAVAATALQTLRNSRSPFDFRAFCVTYDRLFPDREREYARQVALNLGISLECLDGNVINQNDSRASSTYLRPEPFQIDPFYAVADALLDQMEAHARVALTGWDGDTILNESPKYTYATLLKKGRWGRLAIELIRFLKLKHQLPPIGIRTTLKRYLGGYPPRAPFPVWLNKNFSQRLNLLERWGNITSEPPLFHPSRPSAFRILSSPSWAALFERYDSGVTGLPLEVRHPLADLRVVEYALNLPVIPWVIDKEILRAAMTDSLPEKICRRPKSPLAGEPALGLTRSKKLEQIDRFTVTEAVSVFIDRKAIPTIAAETDPNRLWMNARPFILDQWLTYSRSARVNQIMENKNDSQIKARKYG